MSNEDTKTGFFSRFLASFPLFGMQQERDAMPPDVPWVEPELPLRSAVVALVTTGGVHLLSQAPFNTAAPEGDPGLRKIPVETPRKLLCITPDYYDSYDAELDLNLVLPVERLLEFKKAGVIKNLHPVVYSLMGHVSGLSLELLKEETAVQIARSLAAAGVNYALLVPA